MVTFPVITLHTCTRSKVISLSVCARDKAIGFVHLFVCQHKNHQIWRLGIIARRKYHYSVGKVGKLTFFNLVGS